MQYSATGNSDVLQPVELGLGTVQELMMKGAMAALAPQGGRWDWNEDRSDVLPGLPESSRHG